MPKFEKKAETVEAWRTKGNRVVDTADGPKRAVPGQWIVPVGNGHHIILDDAEFRATYKAKDKEAEKALSAEFKTADQEATDAKAKAGTEQEEAAAQQADEDAKAKAAVE